MLIIFDCDGVLIDSEILSAEVDCALLREFGYEIAPDVVTLADGYPFRIWAKAGTAAAGRGPRLLVVPVVRSETEGDLLEQPVDLTVFPGAPPAHAAKATWADWLTDGAFGADDPPRFVIDVVGRPPLPGERDVATIARPAIAPPAGSEEGGPERLAQAEEGRVAAPAPLPTVVPEEVVPSADVSIGGPTPAAPTVAPSRSRSAPSRCTSAPNTA